MPDTASAVDAKVDVTANSAEIEEVLNMNGKESEERKKKSKTKDASLNKFNNQRLFSKPSF